MMFRFERSMEGMVVVCWPATYLRVRDRVIFSCGPVKYLRFGDQWAITVLGHIVTSNVPS